MTMHNQARPLAAVRTIGLAALRLILTTSFCATLLSGCGGGGKGDDAKSSAQVTPSVATASATTSVASDLASGTNVTVVTVQSLTEEKPIGASIRYPTSEAAQPLFALNAAGDIVLAARPTDGATTFTASSTVRVLAGLVLSTYFSSPDVSALEARAAQTPSFNSAVVAFEAALARDISPPTDAGFQARLLTVVKEALPSLSAASSSTTPALLPIQSKMQAMSLVPDRVDPSKRNPVGHMILFETLPAAFGSPLTISLSTDPTKKGIGRYTAWNGTPVYWDVVLTDATGGTNSNNGMTEAASLLSGVFTDGSPLTLVKPGPGAFDVTLAPSLEANAAKLLMSSIKLLLGAGETKECREAIAKSAVNVFIQSIKTATPTPTSLFMLSWSIVKGSWSAIAKPCSPLTLGSLLSSESPEAIDRLFKVVGWVNKVLDTTEIAIQLEIWLKYMDAPYKVGVCVSSSDLVMSCVSSISKAFDPPPIAAGQPDNYYVANGGITFYDRTGTKTSMPADVEVSYLPPGLQGAVAFERIDYDVATGLTYKIRSLNGQPVSGAIRLRDIATDVSIDIPVKVSKGRLGDDSTISVQSGQTLQLPLLEEGGSRSLYFGTGYELYLSSTNLAAADAVLSTVKEAGIGGNRTAIVTITGKKAGENTSLGIRRNSKLAPFPDYLLGETAIDVTGRCATTGNKLLGCTASILTPSESGDAISVTDGAAETNVSFAGPGSGYIDILTDKPQCFSRIEITSSWSPGSFVIHYVALQDEFGHDLAYEGVTPKMEAGNEQAISTIPLRGTVCNVYRIVIVTVIDNFILKPWFRIHEIQGF